MTIEIGGAGTVIAEPFRSDAELLAAEMIERVATTVVPTVVGALIAMIVVAVLWLDTGSPLLLYWLAAAALLYASRIWQVYRFRASGRGAQDHVLALRRWREITMAIGLLWGTLGACLALMHDVSGHALVCVTIAGLCAGTVASASAHPPLVSAFIWPALIPLAAATAWWGGSHNWALAVFCIIFGLAVSLYTRRAFGWIQAVHHANAEKGRILERLAAANERAEAASQAKSMFLATVSHELRTPLNAIIGYSEMLLEDLAPCEPAGGSEGQMVADLRRINGAGQHLLALVNDVLDLSKIEAGRMELNPGAIDLRALVDDVVASARYQIEHNGNSFDLECGASLGTVTADETKLRQVMLNLLSNAGKFTRDGRVTLAVTCDCRDADGRITVTVRDTGIGIEPETMAKLFSDFTQAAAATSGKFGGTGLGLALSRKLCRLMGGDITAESTPGMGSCFTATIRCETAGPGGRASVAAVPESVV
jgi:signal transduction histidine kinase